jgi:hypothetical protein
MSAWAPSAELDAELDRVGVSYSKAGAVDYVAAVDLGDTVWLLGPPRLHSRPTWSGPAEEALHLLASVPDGAGPEAFWAAFEGR